MTRRRRQPSFLAAPTFCIFSRHFATTKKKISTSVSSCRILTAPTTTRAYFGDVLERATVEASNFSNKGHTRCAQTQRHLILHPNQAQLRKPALSFFLANPSHPSLLTHDHTRSFVVNSLVFVPRLAKATTDFIRNHAPPPLPPKTLPRTTTTGCHFRDSLLRRPNYPSATSTYRQGSATTTTATSRRLTTARPHALKEEKSLGSYSGNTIGARRPSEAEDCSRSSVILAQHEPHFLQHHGRRRDQ